MYEITLQRQTTLRVPNGKTIRLVVIDIDAEERTNQQTVVRGNSEARQKHVGK